MGGSGPSLSGHWAVILKMNNGGRKSELCNYYTSTINVQNLTKSPPPIPY